LRCFTLPDSVHPKPFIIARKSPFLYRFAVRECGI